MSLTQSTSSRGLGLDDTTQVTHCYNRGEDYFKSDTGVGRINGNTLPSASNANTESKSDAKLVVRTIAQQLGRVKKSYPKGTANYFFPRDDLKEILSIENIRKIVRCLKCCRRLRLDGSERESLAVKIYQDYRLVLATLIVSGGAESLVSLMDEGLGDGCLPLRLHDNENPSETVPPTELVCDQEGHSHPTINSWDLDFQRLSFFNASHAVLSPYFKRTCGGRHIHYHLTENDVLPILEKESPQRSDVPATQRLTQGDPNNSAGGNVPGGFGEVSIVKLHKGHFDFGEYGVSISLMGPSRYDPRS